MVRLEIAVFVLSVMLAGNSSHSIRPIIVSLAIIAINSRDYKDNLKFTFSGRCVNDVNCPIRFVLADKLTVV